MSACVLDTVNSTQSMKALQANNKLLAVSLEKMRRNFHQVHTHYTYLLEWNHELRQKVIELERYKKDMETFILMEANKRYEVCEAVHVLHLCSSLVLYR